MAPADRRAARGNASHTAHRLAGVVAFVLAWSIAARLAGSGALLPSPLRVASFVWRDTLNGDLPRQLLATLARVAAAFVLAMAAGGAAGYAMGRWSRVNAIADTWLVIALNLPLLVIVVLAYIWVGLNDLAAVLAVVVAKAPTVTVTIREGARALDPALDELATVFRLPAAKRLRRVVMPQLLPYLTAAGRSGLSITWKIVLVVELLGRPDGIGFSLNFYFQNFDVTGILGYGLVFSAVMLLVELAVLQPLERRACEWQTDA